MTLTLHLPAELEQRLTQEAERQRLALDVYTLQLLGKSLPPKDRHTELVTLLQSWMDEGDPEEQQETGEYLIRALDEDRRADRPLHRGAPVRWPEQWPNIKVLGHICLICNGWTAGHHTLHQMTPVS